MAEAEGYRAGAIRQGAGTAAAGAAAARMGYRLSLHSGHRAFGVDPGESEASDVLADEDRGATQGAPAVAAGLTSPLGKDHSSALHGPARWWPSGARRPGFGALPARARTASAEPGGGQNVGEVFFVVLLLFCFCFLLCLCFFVV